MKHEALLRFIKGFRFHASSFMNKGFTIIEVVVVILIFSFLVAISIANFVILQKKSELDRNIQEFALVLKLAQNKTLSSENNSQYGVYLDTSVSPHKYVLFKGANYASRDILADQPYWLSNTVEFSNINLGGGSQVVFNKLTGSSQQSGDVSIRLKSDVSQSKILYISSEGIISFSQSTGPSDDNRVKDSRHVHFDYSRYIDTASENITLIFDSTVNQIIPISSYLVSGNIQWSGTVNVGGEDQTVEIKTHRLNNPDTQFSIHRDRRYNSKTLEITLSGDSSGSLAEYSADGLTTIHSSIYVSSFIWQ